MTVLLRRAPTKTASRHSASLPSKQLLAAACSLAGGMGRASTVQFSLTDDRSRHGCAAATATHPPRTAKSALCFTSSLEALSAWRQISRWRHLWKQQESQGENRNQLLQSRQVRYRLQAVAPNIPLPVLARRKTQLERAQCTIGQLDRKIWSD